MKDIDIRRVKKRLTCGLFHIFSLLLNARSRRTATASPSKPARGSTCRRWRQQGRVWIGRGFRVRWRWRASKKRRCGITIIVLTKAHGISNTIGAGAKAGARAGARARARAGAWTWTWTRAGGITAGDMGIIVFTITHKIKVHIACRKRRSGVPVMLAVKCGGTCRWRKTSVKPGIYFRRRTGGNWRRSGKQRGCRDRGW